MDINTKAPITYHLVKKQSQTQKKHYVNPQCAATNDAISSCASAIRSTAFRIPTTSAITASNAVVWAYFFPEKSVGACSAPSSKSTSSCLIVVAGPAIACSLPCVSLCCCGCGSLVLAPRLGAGGKMVGMAAPLTFTPSSKCSEHTHSLSSTCLSEPLGITASHSLHWMSSAVQTYSTCDGSLSPNSLGQPLMLQVIAAVPCSIALEGVGSDSHCDNA